MITLVLGTRTFRVLVVVEKLTIKQRSFAGVPNSKPAPRNHELFYLGQTRPKGT